MGRTGEWFGMDVFGVEPDILAMAKGINSGYVPLGAVGISDAIYDTLKDQFLYIGLTYSGDTPRLCRLRSTIKTYQEEKLIENARTWAW